MANPLSVQDDSSSIWNFIQLADYQSPEVPVSQVAKKGFSQLRRIFRQEEEKTESPFEQQSDLRSPDERLLAQISPALDWQEAGTVLRETLQEWLQPNRPGQNIVLLVEPPYGGHAEVLRAWAAQCGAHVVDPPSVPQIMGDTDAWFSSLPKNDTFWIYPTLEKSYLRHAGGLSLVRRFLDHAASGSMGRGIIGCDSWAWAYLQQVWHGSRADAITSFAFDKERLVRHFQQIQSSNQDTPYHFRQANNGYHLFATDKERNHNENNSDYLQQLAAFSRGNLGVAQAIWRDSLRILPDDTLTEKQDDDDDTTGTSDGRTIWVSSWDDLEHPSLPPSAVENVAFVLHTLLLHGGLSGELLPQLLPLADNQVMETVYQLAKAGLVAVYDATWQVTPRGYPVVRSYLKSNGYLCDTF